MEQRHRQLIEQMRIIDPDDQPVAVALLGDCGTSSLQQRQRIRHRPH
jgi:hypothetical protein